MALTVQNMDPLSLSWSIMKPSRRKSLENLDDFSELSDCSFDSRRIQSLVLKNEESEENSKAENRQESFFEVIHNFGMNLKFKWTLMYQHPNPKDFEGTTAYLLGKTYKLEKEEAKDKLEQLNKDFSQIIWFTYRKNFPSLVSAQLAKECFQSDTGWGCSIRSCQMLFGECLKAVLSNERFGLKRKAKPTEKAKKIQTRRIIEWFLDCELNPKFAPYSIQSISQSIYTTSQIKPGNWLKPSNVLFALQSLHEQHPPTSANLFQMEIFLESTIFIDKIIKKVGCDEKLNNSIDFLNEFEVVEEPEELEASHQEIIYDENYKEPTQPPLECFAEEKEQAKVLFETQWSQPIVIVVLAKIGLDRPNPENFPFIKKLLSFPESIGMLGGKPGLAYYITGFADDKLIYLDPHFVQDTVKHSKLLKKKIHRKTYFCKTMKYMNFSELDPSVGFAFLIKDKEAFWDFARRFKTISQMKDSFLSLELNSPEETSLHFDEYESDDEFHVMNQK